MANIKEQTIVEDFFAQCERCKYWLRLGPLNERDSRPIPLLLWIDHVAEKYDEEGSEIRHERWVCEKCFDSLNKHKKTYKTLQDAIDDTRRMFPE